MTDRIKELLKRYDILKDKELFPITEGASGAYVFSADEKYIVKYANLTKINFDIREQFKKEFLFYQLCSGKEIHLIPEVIFQIANDNEILIVLRKYSQIKIGQWNKNMQKKAMELCARIHAVNTDGFDRILQSESKRKKQKNEPYPLSVSYENWEHLRNKFPESIDGRLLKEMYTNYSATAIYAEKKDIPRTLCHGDCHPENFLEDGDNLILCDWQGVGIGKGIGDVAFFISRGEDMGLAINRDKLIEWYSEAFHKFTSLQVDKNDFYKNIAASEFCVSFRFWAEYLQTSKIDRVLKIYNSMVKSYMDISLKI